MFMASTQYRKAIIVGRSHTKYGNQCVKHVSGMSTERWRKKSLEGAVMVRKRDFFFLKDEVRGEI